MAWASWVNAGHELATGPRVGEKGAGQSGPLRGGGGCSLGFDPWPLKGIGRLHYFQIFVWITNSFDFKSNLKFK
jgi:hypothetical protein